MQVTQDTTLRELFIELDKLGIDLVLERKAGCGTSVFMIHRPIDAVGRQIPIPTDVHDSDPDKALNLAVAHVRADLAERYSRAERRDRDLKPGLSEADQRAVELSA